MNAFDYVVQSDRRFDEVVASVEALTAEKGFRVLAVHDIQATLQGKGFEIGPMKIVELCSAKHAYKVIAADPRISQMLPCRISVYRAGDQTTIAMMRPTAIAEFFPLADIGEVSAEVEKVMKEIVEGSANV